VTATTGAPAWVGRVLGRRVTDLRRLAWGFTNETWAGTTAGGERLVATRMVEPRSARAIIARGPAIAGRLAAAGIETPVPLAARSDPATGVVVARWLDGTPGIELLHAPGGAAEVGDALGSAWRRLAGVDPSGLGLDELWADPGELARAAGRWLDGVETELPSAAVELAGARVGQLEARLAGRRPGLVHGDLVPANGLIRDAAAAALLDLEAVRLGEPLLDAAWFAWIVRFHHPAVSQAAWAAFAAAGGIDAGDAATVALLEILPTIRILEIVASLAPGPARARWLEQLQANVGAPVPHGNVN
jgi:aminoglycoside phosphotransferase (APT) family kinase protein